MSLGIAQEILGVALDFGGAEAKSLGTQASTKLAKQLQALGYINGATAAAMEENPYIGLIGFAIGVAAVSALSTPVGATADAVAVSAASAGGAAVSSFFAEAGFSLFGETAGAAIASATSLMSSVVTATINYIVSEFFEKGFQSFIAYLQQNSPALANLASALIGQSSNVYDGTSSFYDPSLPFNLPNWNSGASTQYSIYTTSLTPEGLTISVTQPQIDGPVSAVVQDSNGTPIALVYGAATGPSDVQINGGTIDPIVTAPPDITEAPDGSIVVILPNSYGSDLIVSYDTTGNVSLMDGTGDSISGQQIVSFSGADFSGDTIDVETLTSLTSEFITEIGNGDTFQIDSDASVSSILQDFSFAGSSGVLQLDAANSFTGTISNFQVGDTIDLTGVTATSATLGAGNVLTIFDGSDVAATLSLDPNDTFSNDGFAVNSDGSGGTDITVELPLVGIGYDSASSSNFLESINPATGQVAALNTFKFDTGYWATATFVDTGTDLFGVSSSDTLYDFDAATGTIKSTLPVGNIEGLASSGDTLVGFGLQYAANPANDTDFLESINPATGDVTVLNTFSAYLFILGYDQFFADSTDAFVLAFGIVDGNRQYGIYDYSATTGACKSDITVTGEIEALAGGGDSLLAITYNETTSNNSLESINLATGQETVLNTFKFDTGSWYPETFTDNGTDAYAVSTDGLMYEFNATTGALISTSQVGVLEALKTPNAVDIMCFAKGTRILTPSGEVEVNELAIGDTVSTNAGGQDHIKFIGRRSYGAPFINNNPNVQPVCIAANAIAEGVPARDLRVSPGHAIFIDGVLIHASRLVNGKTITQDMGTERIDYFHVELESGHDILIAEGCAAESFRNEQGFRNRFQNAAEFYALYPDDADAAQFSCYPRLESGFHLHAILQRLAKRADIVEQPHKEIGPLRGYLETPGTNGIVVGWAQDENAPETPVCLDVVVDGKRVVRVLANYFRADLRAAGLGSGCHGFEASLPANVAGQVEVKRSIDQAALPLTHTAAARLRVA